MSNPIRSLELLGKFVRPDGRVPQAIIETQLKGPILTVGNLAVAGQQHTLAVFTSLYQPDLTPQVAANVMPPVELPDNHQMISNFYFTLLGNYAYDTVSGRLVGAPATAGVEAHILGAVFTLPDMGNATATNNASQADLERVQELVDAAIAAAPNAIP